MLLQGNGPWLRAGALAVLATMGLVVALEAGAGTAGAQSACANADERAPAPPAEVVAAIACLVDRERAAAGVPALARDARLDGAARRHAADMVANDYFSDTSQAGRSPADRASLAGYPAGATVQEAIAHGTASESTPRTIVRRWIASSATRGRVLDPDARDVGVGAVAGVPGDRRSGTTAVLMVGTPAAANAGAVAGKTAVIKVLSGTVYVLEPRGPRRALRAEGTQGYGDVTGTETIRIGSRVDTRTGTIRLTSAADLDGGTQTADFRGGIFLLRQTAVAAPVTELALIQPLASCGKATPRAKQSPPSRRAARRSLFASGKGRFRTRGRYASAAVRGTTWKTEDTCAGTTVSVATGVVTVTDTRSGKAVDVGAGKSLLVKRKR